LSGLKIFTIMLWLLNSSPEKLAIGGALIGGQTAASNLEKSFYSPGKLWFGQAHVPLI
jgi:hypothetical protein